MPFRLSVHLIASSVVPPFSTLAAFVPTSVAQMFEARLYVEAAQNVAKSN